MLAVFRQLTQLIFDFGIHHLLVKALFKHERSLLCGIVIRNRYYSLNCFEQFRQFYCTLNLEENQSVYQRSASDLLIAHGFRHKKERLSIPDAGKIDALCTYQYSNLSHTVKEFFVPFYICNAENKDFRRCWLASQRGVELSAPRLGEAPRRFRPCSPEFVEVGRCVKFRDVESLYVHHGSWKIQANWTFIRRFLIRGKMRIFFARQY